jgi:hypothetical protein
MKKKRKEQSKNRHRNSEKPAKKLEQIGISTSNDVVLSSF